MGLNDAAAATEIHLYSTPSSSSTHRLSFDTTLVQQLVIRSMAVCGSINNNAMFDTVTCPELPFEPRHSSNSLICSLLSLAVTYTFLETTHLVN